MNQTSRYSLRLTSFLVRNFRSLRDVKLTNLPPAVLLYGENDTGKSNLIQAVGVWLKMVQALAKATPQKLSLRDVSIDLYEGHDPDWSEQRSPELPGPLQILGNRPDELFCYGSNQFELEGQVAVAGPAGNVLDYQFGFRVSRGYGSVLECTVLTALWPDGRKDTPLSPLESSVETLRWALCSPWQQVGAERRFDDEQLPITTAGDEVTAIDPTGSDLKLRLFRAAHGLDASWRALFREQFVPLIMGQPFGLPEPLPVVDVNGKLELLLGNHVVEHRGSGPQQWVLIGGLLVMSQAAVAGLEEPEAHLSWEAQRLVAGALGEWVRNPSYPPYQLFVSSHSPLMLDICSPETVYYKFSLQDGETRIQRSQDTEEFQARFFLSEPGQVVPRRLLSANLVRLSEEAVKHLSTAPGDKLFELKEADGSLRLVTTRWMDKYLG